MVPYIKELLKTHDCVIIPGLGGLIGHYEPARRNMSAGTMAPPMKRIAFNSLLRQSDGLLINHVVRTEGLSYPNATAKVDAFKQKIEQALRLNGSYLFAGIGKLSYDEGEKLHFYPILKENLLLETYGLPLVVAQPVRRIAEQHAATKAIIPLVDPDADEVILPEFSEDQEDVTYKPWMFRAAAAIGMAFLMTTAGISFVQGDISTEQLSIFPTPRTIVQTEMIASSSSLTINTQPDLHLYEAKPNEQIADEVNDAIATDVESINDNVTDPSGATIDHANKFYVIVGSFLDQVRMNREIRNMEAKGFTVETIPGPNGYTRVALVFDANRVSKSAKLKEIRASVNAEAWMINS